jgi:outer membrane receptor for monomeric catechols
MQRDLATPVTEFVFDPEPAVAVEYVDGEEKLARAYLFAALHRTLTVGAEYHHEELEQDPDLFGKYSTVTTRRLPLSARYFHPSGISVFVGATHFDQEGEFGTFNEVGENVFVPGERSFWVYDAALSYRLAKRFGFLVAGVNNLTDEQVTYQATDPNNLSIRPGRFGFARIVLAFP